MKKSNQIIGFLVLAILIAIGIGALLYASTLDHSTPFNSDRPTRARILYERVMTLSYDNYPNSPAGVMETQADILLLMYGEFIADYELFAEVIAQQRLLFGTELLQLNSFESQYMHFFNYQAQLREQGVRLISTEVMGVVNMPGTFYRASARLQQNFSGLGTVNWIYHLEFCQEVNRWQIHSWSMVDEYFRPLQ